MKVTRDKLKEIYETLHAARAQLFVMQQALHHGDSDLELLSSDVLESLFHGLCECEEVIYNLGHPLPPKPRPPGKRRSQPSLEVVKAAA